MTRRALGAGAVVLGLALVATTARASGEVPEEVPGIRGRVLSPEDERHDRLHVWALRVPAADSVPDPTRLMRTRHRLSVAPGAPFALDDLAPGFYALAAGRWFGRACVTVVVEVREGPSVIDLAVPPLSAEESLPIRILAPAPEPGHARRIWADYGVWDGAQAWEGHPSPRATRIAPIAMRDGSFRLVPNAQAAEFFEVLRGEREGVAFVTVRGDGAERTVVLRAGEPAEVTVSFADSADLELTLAGDPGSLDAIVCSLSPTWLEHPHESREARRGGDLRRWMGLEPGEYRLHVRSSSLVLLRRVVVLAPGQNRLSVDVPSLYKLRVWVPDGALMPELRSTLLRLQPLRASELTPVTVQAEVTHGVVTFQRVPPGPYLLQGWGPRGPALMRVEVEAETAVEFAPEPIATHALDVTLQAPDGVLAEAGFERGDRIVGVLIERQQFYGQEQLERALAAAGAAGKDVTVVVMDRRGMVRTLGMTPPAGMDPIVLGGTIGRGESDGR